MSADIQSASVVADLVLPYLASRRIMHKVVRSVTFLAKQSSGDQAGKFITIYMDARAEQKNALIKDLGEELSQLRRTRNAQPSPKIPRSRPYSHVFIEQPLDEASFIYGGFVCDPSE